jgi:GNAT superfamily N-acetyltransferase
MRPRITSTPENIDITVVDDVGRRSIATASANPHFLHHPEERCWWISRVLVSDQAQRGKGYGGMVLDHLLAEIVKAGGRVVIVTPGGYGADPARQVHFYESHDFFKVGEGYAVHWAWNPDPVACQNLAVRAAEALVRRQAEVAEAQDQAG